MAKSLNRIALSHEDRRVYIILYYPRGEGDCSRIDELKRLNITHLVMRGTTQLAKNVWVLGKGTVSIVVEGLLRGERRVAVKVRRLDANRPTLKNEAELLKMANILGVGPKLYGYSDNFIVMELIEGTPIDTYILNAHKPQLVKVIKDLLEQCRKLDSIGLDHGELSLAKKHVYIVDEKPVIIDFESTSMTRKPTNLTSIISYLLLRKSKSSKRLQNLLKINPDKLIDLLRKYKKKITQENYQAILNEVFKDTA